MVNDRGSIKWSAMMMPEHIEMLKKSWKEQERREKPLLDEQQKEEIEGKLQLAIHNDLTIQIKYFKGHDFYYVLDKIASINVKDGSLYLKQMEKLKLNDIIDVKIF
ncbi:YolD-like family protein [Virgibacillus kimchii]